MSFHVFLSHSSVDKPAAEELARRLLKEGIQAWLDKWHLIPGDPWQPAIERALAESGTCAVFVGPSGLGPWQNEEMRVAIDRRVSDANGRFRVIPVLLPGGERAERSSLPSFLAATTWVEFRDSLDDQDAFRRLVCGIRGVEPGTGPGQAIYEGQCPYRGLRVFDVGDAPFFFGREALVQWLLNEVRPAAESQPVNRFLAIVGASGSGKSSVGRAGLVPALKHDAIPGSARWPVAVCRPGPDPLESLAVVLSRAVNVGQRAPELAELIAEFQRNEKTLHLIARQSLPENAPDMRLVIFVDQFEEIFTLCRKHELREALIRNLLYAAKVAQGRTLVILTMRADFYGKCAANAELAAAFSDHNVLVGPMTEEELRRAIERPTQLVGCELESGLVDLLVQDVRHQPGALPLLQHALLELWNKREGRRLSVKAYQEIGKLEGALQRRADATLKAFSEDEQEFCRRTFLRLTQPGEGTEDTKRRASMQELRSLSGKSIAEEEIIQKLVNAFLLTTEGELSRKDVFVEVAHEALVQNWPQLRKWIDADRAGLRTRTRLTEAASEWENAGKDPAYLYTGARLASAEEWAGSHRAELSTAEAEFLRFSLEAKKHRETEELEAAQRLARAEAERAEEAEIRRREQAEAAIELKRQRTVAQAGSAANYALRQFESGRHIEALLSARKAGESLRRVARGRPLLDYPTVTPVLALQIILDGICERNRLEYWRESDQAFVQGNPVISDECCSILWGGEKIAIRDLSRQQLQQLMGHEGDVLASGCSPNGSYLVTTGVDGTVRLRKLLFDRPARLIGLQGGATVLAFDDTGQRVTTKDTWGTVVQWDLSGRNRTRHEILFEDRNTSVVSVSFNSKGSQIATGGMDGFITLWGAGGDKIGKRIATGQGRIIGIKFDRSDSLITSIGEDGTIKTWNRNGHLIVNTQSPRGSIIAAAFSPGDAWIGTVHAGGGVTIWTPGRNSSVQIGQTHRGGIYGATFNPARELIATAGADDTVRFWSLLGTETMQAVRAYQDQVMDVSFSPDGALFATAGRNGTAKLWTLSGNEVTEFVGHRGAVLAVEFSPDGSLIATGGKDGTVRLWLRSGEQLAQLDGYYGALPNEALGGDFGTPRMCFGPNNKTIACVESDGMVRLWRVQTLDELLTAANEWLQPYLTTHDRSR
jgi:WD40 repeat protein